MALSEEQRRRLTDKALKLQERAKPKKSVLEPYRDWIYEMIQEKELTFKVVTEVLNDECQVKITEQSLNEWYRRHIGPPPRARKPARRASRSGEKGEAGGNQPQERSLKFNSPDEDFNTPSDDDWKIT